MVVHKSNSVSSNKLTTWRALPKSIWAMGFCSLFMDISSELIHSLLPVFLVTVLGASMVTVGIIEGLAVAAASIVKIFSGALSDYLGKRKILMVIGYTSAAISKPIFPLATSVTWVFAARFIDRVAKGIRGAPRDALVADLTPLPLRGAAYGLRQALDSVGALIGPLLAVLLLLYITNDIRTILWFAVIPAIISVVVLLFFVIEPKQDHAKKSPKMPLSIVKIKLLPLRFWLVVLLGAVFTLARFSEAFLILRSHDVGLTLSYVPLVMVVMNVFYAAAAYPAGAAADRVRSRTLLVLGLVFLVAADIVLALAASHIAIFAGAALWGLHMAFTQGLLTKLVADTTPTELRGTGFGIFHLITGVALLLASVIAGMLWASYGAQATFFAGAIFASIATIGLLVAIRNHDR